MAPTQSVATLLLPLLIVAGSASNALADRVALVIGNSTYAHVGHLPNAGNDAADLSSALRRLGFQVTTAMDTDRASLNEALRVFTRRSVGADVALVFYAGHGLEMDGVNYLVPVDARLERDTDVRYEAVVLDDVLAATTGASLRIVILDACRDNPLARSMQRTLARRSVSRGSFGELNEDLLGDETLVAYAAAAGTTAADGEGRNSPYTTALLQFLEQPLELGVMFRQVRARVLEATAGEQRPHEYASLLQEHYLGGRTGSGTAGVTASASSDARLQQETVFWQSIADSTNPGDFEAYLRQFPAGTYGTLARNRLVALRPDVSDLLSAPAPPPALTRDRDVPAVFMFEYEPAQIQKFGTRCPGIRITPAVAEANVLIFGYRGPHLGVRDARGGWLGSSAAGGQDDRFEFACDVIMESRNSVVEHTVGERPATRDSPLPVVFMGVADRSNHKLFTPEERQAFTRECSRVEVTQDLNRADFILLGYGADAGWASRNRADIFDMSRGRRVKWVDTLRRRNAFDDLCEYFPRE